MRLQVVIHYASFLLMGLGLCMFLPLCFSLHYGEDDTFAFLISMLISFGTGFILFLFTRKSRGIAISRRESLAVVTLVYILASLFGALPYQLAGTFSNFLDCFFEAASGFTTTGATVLTSIESEPHGILLWRNLTQWLGGMGIVVLFVALFPLLGMGTAYLFDAEAPGSEIQRLRTHVRHTSQIIWLIYGFLTAVEVLLLETVGGLPFFDSLCHTFSTVSIGGFSPNDASIGAYESLSVRIIIICFMFMAGINFALYYALLWRRSFRPFWESAEFRIYTIVMIGACTMIAIDLVANASYSIANAAEEAAFNGVSINTTTGFAVSDFAQWPAFSRMALLALMVIGACAGSTGGATKVIRIAVLAKYAYRQVLLAFNPKAVIPLRLGGKVISEKVVSRIIGFTVLYFAFLAVGTLIMTALEDDFITALSSVVASVGNVGPGLGAVGPMDNYASISAGGKGVLMICMLVGRLEILTVLTLFTPAFWRWR